MNKKQKEVFDLLCGEHLREDVMMLRQASEELWLATSRFKLASSVAGSDLRKERIARGISLRKCARDMGISPTFLSDIERGKRMLPKEIWN